MIGSYAPGFVDLAADPFLLRKALGIHCTRSACCSLWSA